jgi:hypothetical protein
MSNVQINGQAWPLTASDNAFFFLNWCEPLIDVGLIRPRYVSCASLLYTVYPLV